MDQETSLEDLKRALDHAAIVATTDVSGRITYVNDRFCEISGYRREELIGQDHRIINSGFHPKEFIRTLWHTIAQGKVWHGELRNRAKDGHFYWVDTTIVPFLTERGKPYQYIAIRSDISARKAAEEQLVQQAALASVGKVAAVVAHEVRNPLAGIKGAVQVLMGRRQSGDADVPIMRDIVSRIDALSNLIDELMVFARPQVPRIAALDLRALAVDAVELVRRDAVAAQVAIAVLGTPAVMNGDPDMLRAALVNLLLNAAQAMNGTGAIDVQVLWSAAGATIEVRDGGPGIPDDVRARVFDPFFTTKARGGGLGLSIARRTVALHGGTMTLDCPASGGTVVTIHLPSGPAAAAGKFADVGNLPPASRDPAHGAARE